MIRKTLYPEIRQRLDKPPLLVPEDFDISTSSGYDAVIVRITYAPDDTQYFQATIANQKAEIAIGGKQKLDFRIELAYSPGEIVQDEKATSAGLPALLASLDAWIVRVCKDIEAEPVYRALQAHDAKLKEMEKALDKIPDDYATPEQVEKLKLWLTQIENDLRQKIMDLELDAKQKQTRLDDLEKEFELLREHIATSKARKAFRAILGRLYHAASDPDLATLIENGQKIAGLLVGKGG